jgi:hypothetical protein
LLEACLKQLEEQKGKLYKNLADKENQTRKLGLEGREKDRLVQDLQNRLLEASNGRRHTACMDRLAYEQDLRRDDIARIYRIHAEQTDQQCKRHAREMAEEKRRANDDYRKFRGPLEQARDSAWVQLDKVTNDMRILEARFAQREADLASENNTLRSRLRAQEVETEDCNNRNAILRRELELKSQEFAEQGHALANTTQMLEEKTASAAEENSQHSADVSAKDEKLKEALAQVEQVRNDQAEKLRNALACVKQLEDEKTVLLKERYPSKPQAPEQKDADMVDVDIDIEDIEMTDAFATNALTLSNGNTSTGTALQARCHDCETYRSQLQMEYEAQLNRMRDESQGYKDSLQTQLEAQLRHHFQNQLQAWQTQKEGEIQAWKLEMVGVFLDEDDPRLSRFG